MITFIKVTAKNFQSVGNAPITVDLNRSKLTLVTGPNGSGKSLMLIEAMAYGLFGKPFRSVNLADLINDINKKGCLVEVEFKKGTDEYRVVRGQKPAKFEVYKNGEILDQASTTKKQQEDFETEILGTNFKTFRQVVLLGSTDYVPFMKLSAIDRRVFVEDVLDLQVFSELQKSLKDKLKEIKVESGALESSVRLLENDIENKLDYIKELESLSSDGIRELEDERQENKKELKSVLDKLEHMENNKPVGLGEAKQKLSELTQLKSQLMSRIGESKSTVAKTVAEMSRVDNLETCNSCGQEMDQNHKETLLAKLLQERQKAETTEQKHSKMLVKLETELETVKADVDKKEEEFSTFNAEKQTKLSLAKSLQDLISALNVKINDKKSKSGDMLENKKSELRRLYDKIEASKAEYEEINTKMKNHTMAIDMLKDDGIKASIIRRYIPKINMEVNKYLSKLGLNVTFKIDENFKESIKTQYHEDVPYQRFSEGQKCRIDLAVMLAWREVARSRNSLSTNLLVFDEIGTSTLDESSSEEFVRILKYMENTNVFVIGHKMESVAEHFRSHLKVKLNAGFTEIVN